MLDSDNFGIKHNAGHTVHKHGRQQLHQVGVLYKTKKVEKGKRFSRRKKKAHLFSHVLEMAREYFDLTVTKYVHLSSLAVVLAITRNKVARETMDNLFKAPGDFAQHGDKRSARPNGRKTASALVDSAVQKSLHELTIVGAARVAGLKRGDGSGEALRISCVERVCEGNDCRHAHSSNTQITDSCTDEIPSLVFPAGDEEIAE